MKAPHIKFTTIQQIGLIVCLIILSSCSSLPDGTPPPPDEPIIVETPPITPSSNDNDVTIVKPKEIDGRDAVNYMVTCLATRCQPISGAGNDIPEILNRFTISNNSVNDLPMEVWQKLVRMKMIKPVSDPKEQYAYSLVSEIETLPNPGSKRKKFLWKMRLLQNNPKNQEVWKALFEFTEEDK